MTKDEILQETGLTEQEFYDQYPTPESYFKRGGSKMQMGGQQEQEQLMAMIQAYAEANQIDPEQIMQQLSEADPETQQQMLTQMIQELQEQQQQQPSPFESVMQQPMPEQNPYAEEEDMMQKGGPSKGGQADTYMNKTSNFVNWLKESSQKANMQNMVPETMKEGGLIKAQSGLAHKLAPSTNPDDQYKTTGFVPDRINRGYNQEYGGYDDGWGYNRGYNPGYSYGAPNFNMYGNPLMGLMGLLGSGINGFSNLFAGIGQGRNLGASKEKGLNNSPNNNSNRTPYDLNVKENTPTTNKEIDAINKRNRQLAMQQNRADRKRLALRKANYTPSKQEQEGRDFTRGNERRINNYLDKVDSQHFFTDGSWDQERYDNFIEATKNKRINKRNFNDIYYSTKFQDGGANEYAFNVNDFYNPNEDPYANLDDGDANYNYNGNMLNAPDPNVIGDPNSQTFGNVWETGPAPKGIEGTWKDIKGKNLFDKSQGPTNAPGKSDNAWGYSTNPWAADEVINGIQSMTAMLNNNQQNKADRRQKQEMNDITNKQSDTNVVNRGDWFGSSGLAYGMLRPNENIYSGPNAYAKKGGTWFNNNFFQMGGGNEYNEGDEIYMTDEEIQAFIDRGGVLDFID